MAAAMVVSVKMSPQAATLRLVVRMTEPLWYLCEMTWNSASASWDGMGRYRSSSMMSTAGPEKNLMVAAHLPSRAGVAASGCQVGGGGVVDLVPAVHCGSTQDDCEHGFADPGRSDEQYVGRVGEVGACCEFSDELLVDAGLG